MENAAQRAPRGAKLPSHSDLRHEAHVQHPICFVQHEIAHAAETLPSGRQVKGLRCHGEVSGPASFEILNGNIWQYSQFMRSYYVWHGRNYIKKKQEETGLT